MDEIKIHHKRTHTLGKNFLINFDGSKNSVFRKLTRHAGV